MTQWVNAKDRLPSRPVLCYVGLSQPCLDPNTVGYFNGTGWEFPFWYEELQGKVTEVEVWYPITDSDAAILAGLPITAIWNPVKDEMP